MDVFRPYRQSSPYGSPGYGMYPTQPGAYMNGLGGSWGTNGLGAYGQWGYGIYGLGQNGEVAVTNGNGEVTNGNGAQIGTELEAGYRFAFQAGLPIVSGLLGVGAGLLLGFFVWGR